jgi:putative transposase
LVRLRQLFKQHRERYGYRRVYQAVRQEIPCSIHRVARLMRQDGLKVVPRKGYRQTTQSNHKRLVVPNILSREFTAAAPNLAWLSDITYVPTDQRWLYLAIVLDLYARRVVVKYRQSQSLGIVRVIKNSIFSRRLSIRWPPTAPRPPVY